MGVAKYQNDGDLRTSGPGFGVTTHPQSLAEPYGWSGSQLVFVNSLSDLFHPKVPIGFVRDVFDVIRETPQHPTRPSPGERTALSAWPTGSTGPTIYGWAYPSSPGMSPKESISCALSPVPADSSRASPCSVRFQT